MSKEHGATLRQIYWMSIKTIFIRFIGLEIIEASSKFSHIDFGVKTFLLTKAWRDCAIFC